MKHFFNLWSRFDDQKLSIKNWLLRNFYETHQLLLQNAAAFVITICRNFYLKRKGTVVITNWDRFTTEQQPTLQQNEGAITKLGVYYSIYITASICDTFYFKFCILDCMKSFNQSLFSQLFFPKSQVESSLRICNLSRSSVYVDKRRVNFLIQKSV